MHTCTTSSKKSITRRKHSWCWISCKNTIRRCHIPLEMKPRWFHRQLGMPQLQHPAGIEKLLHSQCLWWEWGHHGEGHTVWALGWGCACFPGGITTTTSPQQHQGAHWHGHSSQGSVHQNSKWQLWTWGWRTGTRCRGAPPWDRYGCRCWGWGWRTGSKWTLCIARPIYQQP